MADKYIKTIEALKRASKKYYNNNRDFYIAQAKERYEKIKNTPEYKAWKQEYNRLYKLKLKERRRIARLENVPNIN